MLPSVVVMASGIDVNSLLTLLLGGGMVATISALFNGVKSLREGSKSRERDTINELIEQRKEAWKDRDEAFDARDKAFDERDYWRNRAGQLEFIVQSNGIPTPALQPLRPQHRDASGSKES